MAAAVNKASPILFKVVQENGLVRFLELQLPHLKKTLNTPNYILQTKGGAVNGMTQYNLRKVDVPSVSLNFADLHSYKDILSKYKKYVEEQKKEGTRSAENHLKKYFKQEDKVVFFTPFPYFNEKDKERVSGFNDEQFLLLNGRTKVNITDYYNMVRETNPDFIVSPVEQVTENSGRKKRKRAAKASLKTFETMQRQLKDSQDSNGSLLLPVILGDDEGLDSYEMRQFKKAVSENEDYYYQGFMLYGNDYMSSPAKYQEMLDFFAEMPKDKVRVLHGYGDPVDILNGVLSGVDLFEADYPLELAQQGFALQLRDFRLTKSQSKPKTSLELSKLLDTKQPKILNMASDEHFSSKEPIVQRCLCYTCKNYNRAYLRHLIEVKEMNASILIGIPYSHNIWVFDRFFQQIRANIGNIHNYIEDFISINCEDKQ